MVGGGGHKKNFGIIIYKFSHISIWDRVDQICFVGVHLWWGFRGIWLGKNFRYFLIHAVFSRNRLDPIEWHSLTQQDIIFTKRSFFVGKTTLNLYLGCFKILRLIFDYFFDFRKITKTLKLTSWKIIGFNFIFLLLLQDLKATWSFKGCLKLENKNLLFLRWL